MMDVSDGLMLDLFRLADASGVGFEVDGDRVPVHDDALLRPGDPVSRALGDGEDFELLFTAPPDLMEALLRHWDLPTPITVIGTVQGAGRILVRAGQKGPASPLGYTHE
jgi:thiamine-monophosphate kinase